MIQSIPLARFGAPLLVAGLLSATQSPVTPQLAGVEVNGARRYTAAEVMRTSGLAPGTAVTVADLDAATKRMAATGLFKQLNYRYVTKAGRMTVTFEIEESDWTMPVVFDNFVWFTDEEIIARVRESVPSFDGTAPATAGVPELLTRELQKLLDSRQIEGQVDFVPQGRLETGIEKFVFRVREPAPKVCAIGFAGAAAIKDPELAGRLSLVGADYSKSYIVNASRGTLTDMYRQRGHWRASFGPPSATLQQGPACKGVAVTVTVDEGAQYAWDRAEWSGNSVLASRDLNALMPIENGDVASVAKVDEGLRGVRKAYGKQGYVQQRATYTPRLVDATRLAVFEIRIEEGPQFRAGTVTFPGLSPTDAATLTRQWRPRAGDVFDASYPERFFDEEILPRLRQSAKPPSTELQVDAQNRVVNVRFVFGG